MISPGGVWAEIEVKRTQTAFFIDRYFKGYTYKLIKGSNLLLALAYCFLYSSNLVSEFLMF